LVYWLISSIVECCNIILPNSQYLSLIHRYIPLSSYYYDNQLRRVKYVGYVACLSEMHT
jgi:hypothetical protein